jgi:hypothetical protein
MWRPLQAHLWRITVDPVADKGFGFWIDVKDRQTALFAVRMAGLSVLITALSALLGALLAVTEAPTGPTSMTDTALLTIGGVLLAIMAFALRAGVSWVVHAATIISVLGIGIQVLITPVYGLIVPIFALLLTISGLRGLALAAQEPCVKRGLDHSTITPWVLRL